MEGILVPIALFAMLAIVIPAYFYWNHKNRVSIMDTVQKAIDQGKDLTPDLLMSLGAAINPKMRDLRRGVVFLSLGVAGLLCSLFFNDAEVVNGIRAGSVFPLMLGVGFMVVWKMNKD